jgi:hypothetical protein
MNYPLNLRRLRCERVKSAGNEVKEQKPANQTKTGG